MLGWSNKIPTIMSANKQTRARSRAPETQHPSCVLTGWQINCRLSHTGLIIPHFAMPRPGPRVITLGQWSGLEQTDHLSGGVGGGLIKMKKSNGIMLININLRSLYRRPVLSPGMVRVGSGVAGRQRERMKRRNGRD